MSAPPTHIFSSTRSRREFATRRAAGPGPALLMVLLGLLAFWAALGVGAAALFGAL